MVDLRTRWLGLELPTPVVVASSPIGDDLDALVSLERAGAGAVVMRSLFEEQLVEEQMAAHRFFDGHADSDAEARTMLPDSQLFAMGPDAYLVNVRRAKNALKIPVIGSLNGTTPGGWTELAGALEAAGADAIELNLYDLATSLKEDSNDVEARQLEVVRGVCAAVRVPVSVKLTPFYASLPAFAKKLRGVGARGAVLFNRFYQPDIDLDALDVVRHVRLSTHQELPLRLHGLALLSGRVDLELAASGGVHSGDDAVKCVISGASVVQLASAILERGPDAMRSVVEGMTERLTTMGYEHVEHARGVLALDKAPDPHAWERLQYVRTLQGWRPRRGGKWK
ncbi:MAG: dihydroorotate dehydrogenase-like protein [Polyangiales bacterium]